MPAIPNTPNPGACNSNTNNAIPTSKRKTAAILTSKPVPISPSVIAIIPNISAPTPGLEIPNTTPYIPSIIRMDDIRGFEMIFIKESLTDGV